MMSYLLAPSARRLVAARRRLAAFQERADRLVGDPERHREASKLLFVMQDALFEMEETHKLLGRVYRAERRTKIEAEARS